jgi:hypothetical protein
MDTFIYLVTAIITIVWSVWTYLLWADRAGFREDSGARFFIMVCPTVFFIVTALAGWEKMLSLRLDLIGIMALDVITLITLLFLVIVYFILKRRGAGGYRFALIFYFCTAAFITIFSHAIKLFPSLLLQVYMWVNQSLEIDFFRFAWIGLDPATKEVDLVSMLNKIVIAVFSYIPIAMVRFIMANNQRKRFDQQIEELKDRIERLEKKGSTR